MASEPNPTYKFEGLIILLFVLKYVETLWSMILSTVYISEIAQWKQQNTDIVGTEVVIFWNEKTNEWVLFDGSQTLSAQNRINHDEKWTETHFINPGPVSKGGILQSQNMHPVFQMQTWNPTPAGVNVLAS